METTSRAPPLPVHIGGGSAVHSERTLYVNFTPAEHANFLAAKVIAHATAFLDGGNDAEQLGRNARSVRCEMISVPNDSQANCILDPTNMLIAAMMGAAAADGETRQDRWMHVMAAMIELVRHESSELKRTGQ